VKNISEMFLYTSNRAPENVAIGYKKRYLTYKELRNKVAIFAYLLKEKGVKRGDVVAIYCEHSIVQVIALLSVASCDAVFQIINTVLKEDQILYQISNSNANFIIGSTQYLAGIQRISTDRELKLFEIDEFGDVIDTSNFSEVTFPITRNIPADVSNIIYTSGSTGRAKGVVIPNRTLLDGARIVSGYLGINSASKILSFLPFNFDYGLNQLLTTFYSGCMIYLHNFTFPKDLLRDLIDEKITGFAAVPSLWGTLFNPKLLDFNEGKKAEKLEYVTTAGGMHSREVLEKLSLFFPSTKIYIMYGLTESFRSSYLPPSEVLNRIGSIGKAVPEVELLVLNEKMEQCKPGERGELYHRGAFISYGYLNDPKTTAQKFIPYNKAGSGTISEMIVKSGDIVSIDSEGYIYIHGRSDAQIKTHGYRLSPSEIEEVALAFEGVSMVAAFGLPDELAGQMVCITYTSFDKTPLD